MACLLIVASGCSDPTGVSPRPVYYVNAATGNDSNTGTSGAPFKTITQALSVADSGDTVQVRPGRYDAALGEQFPLTLAAWVTLVGDEANKGGGGTPTVIVGGGNTTSNLPFGGAIDAEAHTTIAGFSITDSASIQYAAGIVVHNDGVTIRNNRLINSVDWGIVASDSASGGVFTDNVIMGNQLGILFTGGDGSSRLEGNVITANQYGVYYEVGTFGDLGGGSTGSAGGNTLSCNSSVDLYTENATTINGTNNRWDHVPPTTGVGGDINGSGGASTYITTGATLASSPCP
ncbi:MAG: DUF1565 domain-containing protein [Gemmatimonadales bacterium]